MKLEFGLKTRRMCDRCYNKKYYISMDANHNQTKMYYCNAENMEFFRHSQEIINTDCPSFKKKKDLKKL